MTKVEKTILSQLYIAVDHLKEGSYQLNILNKNNVISTITFKIDSIAQSDINIKNKSR